MHIHTTLAAVAITAAAPATASAQSVDRALEALLDREVRSLAVTIAKRALRRGRRAFALGPYIAAGPTFTTQGFDPDVHVGGGLALTRYDISIFISPDRVAEMIKSRATELLIQRYATLSTLSRADLERLIAEVIEEVKAELMLQLVPRRFEPPGFKVALEVDHLIDAGAWQIRGLAGLGVSRVFLSSGLVVETGGGTRAVLPVELSVPMLLSDGLRSPAVEWFGRIDIAITDRTEADDRFVIGARVSLDVI
jgi:hypothetical protein